MYIFLTAKAQRKRKVNQEKHELGEKTQCLDFSLLNGPYASMSLSAPARFLPSQVLLRVSFAPLRTPQG
ncbi:MAG: hypothetical protein ACREVW_06565, partial [Burkholderiales bacterium]